jgi:acetylornithine deacetylase/succinyl-diaminopimelate desuccinylase-like protein
VQNCGANAADERRRGGLVSNPERDFVRDHVDDLHADLEAWVRIPSISADPAHAPDVADSAVWLADALRRTGFPTVEIWPTPGAPAVFAEWPSADDGAPVALVYGHHDVQPVDPPELWVHPPFEPTRVDGPDGPELHGRGASDDKGVLVVHLLGLRAHLAATGRDAPAVTVKMLIEGEEESGSPHFATLLEERKDRLACDVVVVSDTGMAAPDVPSAVTAMRGLADAEITLRGPAVDLHSGSFGGAVPNPLHALAELLAKLHDDRGRVTLPGFYDKVRPLGDRERELMSRVPFDEQAWLTGPAASRATYGEEGFSTLERTGARPTAEVNGMWGGYTGPGHKTIIPAEAHAKVTFRLVSDQAPADVGPQLRAWVEANVPAGIEADVHTPPGGVSPCASDLDSPAMEALVRAIGQAFDTEPDDVLFTREGGSGPEADLVEVLGAPLLFLGAGLPTDRIHSPNERVLLPMLHRGAEAAAHLWRELAALPRGGR